MDTVDTVARVRQASIKVARVQRRIWLIQTLFLPVVTVGGVVAAVAVGRWAWRRRGVAEPPAVAAESTNGAAAAPIRD